MSPNDSPSGKTVTRSVRTAALRSTALATSLAFVAAWSVATGAWAAPKVPLPKPRPIARSVVPKTVPAAAPTANAEAGKTNPVAAAPATLPAHPRAACAGAGHAPACRRAAGPQAGGSGRDGRDLFDLAGRQGGAGKRHRADPQAQAGRRHAAAPPRSRIRWRKSSPNG